MPDVRGRLMLAFKGMALPPEIERRLFEAPAAGITLFRYDNVDTPAQVRALTEAAQAAASARDPRAGPLLIAGDQEGGQFLGLGDGTTPFPGAMALGATGDPALAERVGLATGLELAAMGVNVAYAPICDLATEPANPHLGIRAFGDDPVAVGAFVAATVRGLRAAGVAASAKHFPGLGEADVDSHHALPVVASDRSRLDAVELVPFTAAIRAGVELVMSAHIGLPAVTGDASLPATLSRAVMHDLVRDDLGFTGLTISDALDMQALPQGTGQAIDAIAALRAGVDLLLCAPDPVRLGRVEDAIVLAASRRLFEPAELRASAERLAAVRRRLAAAPQPDLSVVRSLAHLALAREVAQQSITLVRDDDALLPLRLDPGSRILAVMPKPRALTPADTSDSVPAALATALRARWPDVEEIVTSHPPSDTEIAAVAARARYADVIVVGTISASADPWQIRLVEALLDTGRPIVTVALRTPWDAGSYPRARTHVAAYGILEPTLAALTAALFGDAPFLGRLPVAGAGVAA
jgi:beta-N-acetylhexosaminidase